MDDKKYDYYIKLEDITKLEMFIPDFELWLNDDFNFVLQWEHQYNDEEFDFEIKDYVNFNDWLKSNSMSIIEIDNAIHIHPHILLAYSIYDPIIKMNLIGAIFSLPQDTINTLLYDIYGVDSEEDNEE